MTALAGAVWRIRMFRYALVSAICLGIDVATFACLKLALPAALAAAFGYSMGILASWLLSARAVFADRVGYGAERQRQQMLFVISALVGLGLTTATVGLGTALGLLPGVAKLVAVGLSFQATYLIRTSLVFA